MEPIELTTVSTPDDVREILGLQARNLPSALTPEAMADQGFVTVRHDASVLRRMNEAAPAIVAKAAGRVVGYALVMPPSFAADVPILGPLFEMLTMLSWKGVPLLGNPRWFVMGQICIAEGYRGIGIFDRTLPDDGRALRVALRSRGHRGGRAGTRARCGRTRAWASSRCMSTLTRPPGRSGTSSGLS